MTTTQALTPELRRLFLEAVELAPEERRAWLGRQEPELARQVEELLAAAEAAPAFLEQPAAASELSGRRAGPWILEQRLSAGGTGDVYRARRADGEARWLVALKVLRLRPGERELQRFEAERRSLAVLTHPYIVPLVDAGLLEDGRPYLATRLVEGEALDVFCARLDFTARLRLFLCVCAAVQYAHERLIAHCDLKPANILVTSEGMPQLLDFGIARLLSATEGGAEHALTPGYASPEQLAGRALGATSDVWSLGVVLHELTTGQRPRAGPGGTLPPPSSTVRPELRSRLRGDFDALVARALAVDPSERYGSVAALARDVERYLAGRPVEARAASHTHRARLFVRRNQAGSAAVLVGLAALAVGALSLWRDLVHSRAEASAGWRAHAQATVAARMLEDLAHAAGPGLEDALDEASARLAREVELGPEAEGRLRIALGALYLDAGRVQDARAQLLRARELAQSTRGFGKEDLRRIESLLEAAGREPRPDEGARTPE